MPRHFDSNLNEGSLRSFFPGACNPEVITPAEIAAAGILTLPDPEPAPEGKRWDPVTPTLENGVLVGGYVLVDLPVVVPEPNWNLFLAGFVFPGNALYNAIATNVQSSTAFTQEHWQNLRTLLMMPSALRTRESVLGGWEYLQLLLTQDDQALTAETISDFQTLAEQTFIILSEEP